MKTPIVQKFTRALHELDQTGNFSQMANLFSDNCEIGNVAIKSLRGKKGVERFWQDYCATFNHVETKFDRVHEADDKCFLEWTSKGELKSGRPIVYEGLTLIEWDNDHIVRLRAFHDSAVFLKEGGKHLEKTSDEFNVRPLSTNKVMEGGPKRDISTPGEGVLTSTLKDRDAATG
jgi:hypothetical protein